MVHVDEGRVELLVGGLAGLDGRPGRGRHGNLGEHVAKVRAGRQVNLGHDGELAVKGPCILHQIL